MSFLGKALTVVGAVVGIAAAVASGGTLAILAAAFLTVGAAVSVGLIGGSIGKFMNSGVGKGLMMACALGSAATALYGMDASAVSAAQQAQNVAGSQGLANAAANPAVFEATNASSEAANAAAATGTSFTQSVGAGQDIGSMAADPAFQAATNTSSSSLNALNKTTLAPTSELGADPSAAAAGGTTSTTGAVQSGGLAGGSPTGPGMKAMAGQESGATPAGAGPTPGTPAAEAVTPPSGSTEGPYENPDSGPGPATPPSGGGGISGFLSSAMNSKGGAAMIEAGGHALGGIGQGIAQKQAMEDQLKAAQWGNMQWQNPGQVANMEAAAAKPITVPQGYLQRAQAARSLTNAGVQPLPAAAPGAPLAPNPTAH